MHPSTPGRLAICLWLILIMAACSQPPSTPTPTSLATPLATENSELTPQPLPQPSLTPTPAVPLALLVVPPGSDPAEGQALQTLLEELVSAGGMQLEVRDTISTVDLEPEVRVVVALAPDPGLAGLAGTSPGIQFVAIGVPGLQPGSNLSTISPQGTLPVETGFLAGYLAAVVAPEWRVGVIAASDTEAGQAAHQGFLNGAIFYCGLCRQTYPPYNTYPLYVELPAASSPEEWQAAAGTLQSKAVEVAYVAPGTGDQTLLETLAEAGINLIAGQTPPPALQDHWVATLTASPLPALRQLWPDLLAGKGGASLPLTLEIDDVNPDLFSPGKQQLVARVLADLSAGFIDPGSTVAP